MILQGYFLLINISVNINTCPNLYIEDVNGNYLLNLNFDMQHNIFKISSINQLMFQKLCLFRHCWSALILYTLHLIDSCLNENLNWSFYASPKGALLYIRICYWWGYHSNIDEWWLLCTIRKNMEGVICRLSWMCVIYDNIFFSFRLIQIQEYVETNMDDSSLHLQGLQKLREKNSLLVEEPNAGCVLCSKSWLSSKHKQEDGMVSSLCVTRSQEK